MAVKFNPYIGFKDQARPAMEFYKTVFGGDLKLSTFKELHATDDPAEENLIMHSVLEVSDGMVIMASDTPSRMEYKKGTDLSLSLSGQAADEKELTGYFDKLSEGGEVVQPLTKAQWGDIFGMVNDKFGIRWLVNIGADAEK
ncbi:MAG TPA: VOC family protein [Candidatus Saccharimonadia bacterium]|jgi:PhnB protein|nr:VOC family protein [Candidatus Saccharimonadia bacterium]